MMRSVLAGIVMMVACGGAAPARAPTYATLADVAVTTLAERFYRPPGAWNACLPAAACGGITTDWGADALTGALFLRWRLTRDARVVPLVRALGRSATTYGPCRLPACTMWSDVPLWDAVADTRVFEVTGDRTMLVKAMRAFDAVDRSDAFGRGACPELDFQQPAGGRTALKTLESDSNYVRAALLLARWTGDPAYLTKARAKYAAIRRYFLDGHVPLYSVYVFDDGAHCTQLPGRFFASVNGNMIEAGLALAALTRDAAYAHDARATARAVARYLNDAAGVYANLQADNDVAGPLVDAMYDLAARTGGGFARHWLRAASAASIPAAGGAYGRFFDGPPPTGPISAWSSDGGLELAIAAGALDPHGIPAGSAWRGARYIAASIRRTPAAITMRGRAIALLGSIGAVCCEAGHVRVFVDGHETFDTTGIWQNKTPASRTLPDSVLFSWRWPRAGRHTIGLLPGIANAKEGGSFIALDGYLVIP